MQRRRRDQYLGRKGEAGEGSVFRGFYDSNQQRKHDSKEMLVSSGGCFGNDGVFLPEQRPMGEREFICFQETRNPAFKYKCRARLGLGREHFPAAGCGAAPHRPTSAAPGGGGADSTAPRKSLGGLQHLRG